MTAQFPDIAVGRLERSCSDGGAGARIRTGMAAAGIEWAGAFFRDRAFAPHRHDRYAIGVTVAGVQTFAYRGAARACRVGDLHVLHPDETHDGAPGDASGFAYRILYIDPAEIGAALRRSAAALRRRPGGSGWERTGAAAAGGDRRHRRAARWAWRQ